MKSLALAVVFALYGCHTMNSDYARNSDLEASLPRAQGLGAFAHGCLFFCSVHATFTQGNMTPVEVLDEEGKIKSHDDISIRLKSDKPVKLKRPKPQGVK
jgi:hypothetical protein